MQIESIHIHNFRSIEDATVNLGDYSLLVGANNSGKSNLIDALRIVYEKGLKYEEVRDFPKFPTGDKESWVDIQFILNAEEYQNLKDEYRQPDNRLRVRKYFKSTAKGSDNKVKSGVYGYVGDTISDEHFYGAKNIQQGKLGDIIYIPAASRLDDHTKLTGPSALRDLLNEIVKKLIQESTSFKELSSRFEDFTRGFKAERTADDKSLTGLEGDLNEYIEEWGTTCALNINPISEADIVKNLVSFDLSEEGLEGKMEASQYGQGFQRHLIFALIRTASKYQSSVTQTGKKEFHPNMTLLLFEEPEAYLHPTQQSALCRSLKSISKPEGHQTLITTHSPNFVSHNCNDLPSLIRLCRQEKRTIIGQISTTQLTTIFSANQEIADIVAGSGEAMDADDLNEDMEAIKYFLWLNPDRCGMFFARQVLLVEGPTEKILLNYLFDTGKIETPVGGVFVLDGLGKFNIHRFMNILGPLNITHSVLCDADNSKAYHAGIRDLIEDSRNSNTNFIEFFPNDIETFLGIDKAKRHKKPQHVMLRLSESKISEKNLDALIALVTRLISPSLPTLQTDNKTATA